jgi:hypothetical protein
MHVPKGQEDFILSIDDYLFILFDATGLSAAVKSRAEQSVSISVFEVPPLQEVLPRYY